jgi:uncharacterized protein (TIGR02611 family)
VTALRILKISGGVLVLIAGVILALPLVPGPGILLVFLGLTILSQEFAWAKRILAWAKQKWRSVLPEQ